jgi:hypothetical protein
MRSSSQVFVSVLGLALLAGCSGVDTDKAEELDATLLGKGSDTDPALTSALEDQIMVDPSLSNQANRNAVRSAEQPLQAPMPTEATGNAAPVDGKASLGEIVAKQVAAAPIASPVASGKAEIARAKFAGCGDDISYSMVWSAKLPADLPLFPSARVAEAAGSDTATCNLRAVTFSTTAAPSSLVSYYLSTAKTAGYQANYSDADGEQIVTGLRRDGAAFYVVLTPRDSGGTMADIVANRGT